MTDDAQGLAGIGDITSKLQAGMAGSPASGTDIGALLGHMNMTTIMISLLAGLIGSAYLMYGKKTSNLKMALTGIALCVVPYFITNAIVLVVSCIAMAAVPFI
ncbi:hypothetical protein GMSM_18260 [Geomonas sp. Red276]